MPMLRIRNKLPTGEMVTLSIDGVPQTETSIFVPETFRMKIEQYRISCSGKSTAVVVGTVLAVLVLGGKASWGNEMSSPYYAIWEGTCQMEEDGEIEIWLREDGVEVNFVPWSETVIFEDVESRTGGRDPAQIGRWALMNLPPALFVSIICLILFFTVGVFGIDASQEKALWIFKLVFLIYPPYMLFSLWKSALRPLLGAKRIDWEKRMTHRLVIQIIVVTVLAGAAVFEILSIWVFHSIEAIVTIFPATALLIIHLTAVTHTLEQAERSGIRSESLEKKLKWSRRLRIAACVSVAVIALAWIAPVLIVKMLTR